MSDSQNSAERELEVTLDKLAVEFNFARNRSVSEMRTSLRHWLISAASLGAAHERDACAALVASMTPARTFQDVAASIRARGSK